MPLVAVPIISVFLGVEHAVIVLQVPNILANFWLIWSNKSQFKITKLRFDLILLPAITVVIGTWFLSSADKEATVILLVAILGAFLVLLWFKPGFKLANRTERVVTPVVGTIGGFLQGATGVSGPIFSSLLYSLRLSKEGFIFYNGLLYGFFNSLQLVAMVFFGMFTTEHLLQGLLSIIPVFIFLHVGMRMARRVSLSTFNRIVVLMLVAIEIKLIWSAIGG